MSKSKIMPSVVLGAICLAVALMLSLVNMATKDRIIANQNAANNKAYADVLAEGVTITGDGDLTKLPDTLKIVEAIKTTSDGGFAFKVRTQGYKPDFVVVCGVSGDGKITGTKYTSSNETNGAEDKINGKYDGADLETLEIVLVGGSTKTSTAYHKAVEASLQAYTILSGGTVDTRDPAVILNEKLNIALGTESLEFKEWIGTSIGLDGKIYIASDNSGVVVAIDKTYIGFGSDGVMKDSEATEEEKTKATAVYTAYTSAELVDVTALLDAYKQASSASEYVPSISAAYKMSDGTYVLQLEAKGYGINGSGEGAEYIKSKKPIYIEICIDDEGKIVSTVTTEQNESAGKGGLLGTECGTSDYYSQFNGKTEGELDSLGTITGATFTTKGYREAVKCAVAIVKLIAGGNE